MRKKIRIVTIYSIYRQALQNQNIHTIYSTFLIMMRYFSTVIFLLITSELLFTAADEQSLGKKTGLVNSLLRSSSQHPFDKLTSTGGATRIIDAPGDVAQWRKPGGLNQAFDDFVSLPGKSGKDVSKDNKIIFTKDMGALGKVTMREHSTEGSPTLELQRPSGGSKYKAIRYSN